MTAKVCVFGSGALLLVVLVVAIGQLHAPNADEKAADRRAAIRDVPRLTVAVLELTDNSKVHGQVMLRQGDDGLQITGTVRVVVFFPRWQPAKTVQRGLQKA